MCKLVGILTMAPDFYFSCIIEASVKFVMVSLRFLKSCQVFRGVPSEGTLWKPSMFISGGSKKRFQGLFIYVAA